MALKALLLDFNGVILDDERIHEQLIQELLVAENLRPQPGDFRNYCLGCSDRAGLTNLLASRGRVVSQAYLEDMIKRKSQAYLHKLDTLDQLPLFQGVQTLIQEATAANLKIAIVSGALRLEIETVLTRSGLAKYIHGIVAAEDVTASKPDPEGYQTAIQRLREQVSTLSDLSPQDCLALEDTFPGIEAAKAAHVPVVGVAHTYPFHMLQRCTNWTVDYLSELELPRIQAVFAGQPYPTAIAEEKVAQ
ncbi:HAD family hydrolase [Lyngbya confervoides]|uniref:HAD family phosphatase n=1 Tax=Lyngbya confervoides BDU141951 TaxID=1574623 RepID=A0ABD4T4Q2_9CYAN|nr:HAD family phosphatase [Lyngbya confervoides]MCM1983555.1 HAD family phosphatase [Lyngbya confervoides BDU141951]